MISLDAISDWIVGIIWIVVIIVLSLLIGRVLGKFVERLLYELEISRLFKKNRNVEEKTGIGVRYAVYLAGLIFTLDYFGVELVFYRFAFGLLALFLLFGLVLNIMQAVPNVIASFIIHKRKLGEKIEKDGLAGRIIARDITGYRLLTKENDLIKLPYSQARKIGI